MSSNENGRQKRQRLIRELLKVQREFGYLPKEKLKEIATLLEIEEAEVWGVATFYNIFRLKPPGRRQIKVCMGTACHLAGGNLVLEAAERELKIKVGDTTEDLEFSLERVACLGCCMLAPVVMIDGKVYPRMSPLKFEEILVEIKGEKKEG